MPENFEKEKRPILYFCIRFFTSLNKQRRFFSSSSVSLQRVDIQKLCRTFLTKNDTARVQHQESLAIFRVLGDKAHIASSLRILGNVIKNEGDYGGARVLLEESLVLCRELGNSQWIAHSLEAFASLAVKEGQEERGVRLWGAARALRETISSPLPPNDREKQERDVAAAREALGEAVFTVAWERGRAMTWEQGIEYALENA